MKKIKQAQQNEKTAEHQSQKNLIQEALFEQKASTRFFTQVLQVMQVPNHRIALPTADLPIFQPPQLG